MLSIAAHPDQKPGRDKRARPPGRRNGGPGPSTAFVAPCASPSGTHAPRHSARKATVSQPTALQGCHERRGRKAKPRRFPAPRWRPGLGSKGALKSRTGCGQKSNFKMIKQNASRMQISTKKSKAAAASLL